MPAIIEVKNLTKRYGSFTAVDDISFSVEEGETFGILGPNGAGKTTTLEMMEGLKLITSGRVTLDGLDVSSETDLVKHIIGVQLQASSFFDGLNLVELIETFASIYGRKIDALQLLDMVQLKEKAGNLAKELSGGQKQRLSIAAALVNDPKVVFLDEPTTGLDPQARRNLWNLISRIKHSGKTVIMTTHYMEEAEILCDRIAIMDHAEIVALDTTANLLQKVGTETKIRFQAPHHILPIDYLRELPGVLDVHEQETNYQITTTEPQDTVSLLLDYGRMYQVPIINLELRQPTLEDVFLHVTGHALRD
jgi:ABC-2 type transport system ATP-binding protein